MTEVETATVVSSLPPTPGRPRHIGMWLARVMLLVVFLTSGWLAGTSSGRGTSRAAQMLAAIIGAGLSSAPSTSDPAVRHTTLTVQAHGGDVYLDIYEPRAASPPVPGSRQGIILIPGVGDNRPIPQLINLAESFARNDVTVELMTTPALLSYTLAQADQDAVVQAFLTLAHRPGINPQAIGLIGFSAGGAVASLGAADARIRDQVAYLTMFGSYTNATELLRDLGRRALVDQGISTPWQPDPVPVEVLANTVANSLPDTEAYLIRNAFSSGFIPLDALTLQTLSPSTQAAYHLLAGDEPDQTETNIARLSPEIDHLLLSLSPDAYVNEIHAPIYLMHDRHDPFVPYTESKRLAGILAHSGHHYEYAEFDIFAHVEVRTGSNYTAFAGDGLKLWHLLAAMLSYGA